MRKREFDRLRVGDQVMVNFSNSCRIATVIEKEARHATVEAPQASGPGMLSRRARYQSLSLPTMPPFEKLRALLEAGRFHHATYRNIGTLWEGLWFYATSETGFRGCEVAGCVRKGDPDLKKAEDVVRHTGVSVGSYGAG